MSQRVRTSIGSSAATIVVTIASLHSGVIGARAQITEIVSISSTGQSGNNISGRFAGPAISGNGRVIAFDSMATTLVPGDTNIEVDVFVHDRDTDITERVSVSSTGVQGNDTSTRPAIDGTGNLVVFDSSASNLVLGDNNNGLDVFVHNRTTHTTERASVSSSEAQGNNQSFSPTISADGRSVCFISLASNLVTGDTNGVEDVFVRDLIDGTTERVNLTSGGEQGNSSTTLASISADGRWVTFQSFATNFVPDDTNGHFDVFLHDRDTGITERVSLTDDEQEANAGCSGPSVNGDGRFVVFYSNATNLVSEDTNERTDIFLRDRLLGATERVSVSSTGEQGDGNSQDPAVRGFTASGPQITPDGRFVSFFSSSTNLVPRRHEYLPTGLPEPTRSLPRCVRAGPTRRDDRARERLHRGRSGERPDRGSIDQSLGVGRGLLLRRRESRGQRPQHLSGLPRELPRHLRSR